MRPLQVQALALLRDLGGSAKTMPVRISEGPSWCKCKWCDHREEAVS